MQTPLAAVPVWTRASLPESKDALAYVLKTRQMEECFFQDCLALEDLRKQSHASQNPDVTRQRLLSDSRVFPIYHPLWSAIFLGIKGLLGVDLITTYKIVWTVAPLFFGLAFACLLTSLWGAAAAGAALVLLAFKVFPDTGLHYVVPSNLTMATAVLLWARIIAKKGQTPLALVLGTLALVTMHPIGRLFSLMGACMALVIRYRNWKPKELIPILLTFCIVGLSFIKFSFYGQAEFVSLDVVPNGASQLLKIFQNAASSLAQTIIESVRLGDSLFGSIPVFFGAIVLGFCTLQRPRRIIAIRVSILYVLFILPTLFFISSHPGDVPLRMWIPLVVILFGAIGHSLSHVFKEATKFVMVRFKGHDVERDIDLREAWALVALAILVGYSFQMITNGCEHVVATIEHVQNREPIALDASQPALLLSRAKPGDRVLYTSMTIMPYFLSHGAMRLGAVLYQPVMNGDPSELEWLVRPDLKFAVAYNPAVYHPSFEGTDEFKWWITAPDYRYSVLNRRRFHNPLMRDGALRAGDFRWIQIDPQTFDFPKKLKILVTNPGGPTRIGLMHTAQCGKSSSPLQVSADIAPKFSGWVELDLSSYSQSRTFKIMLLETSPKLLLKGIVFGDDPMHWPWAQRALLTFMPRDPNTGSVTRSYDPATLLPPPLNAMRVNVLDDGGSSVLLEIDRDRPALVGQSVLEGDPLFCGTKKRISWQIFPESIAAK